MSTKEIFVGRDASFYKALLGRNFLGQADNADFSAMASQVVYLNDEINRLHDEVDKLEEENQYIKKQFDELQKRVKMLEKRS